MSGHVVESLSAYLDGELPTAERQAVEGHLRTCDECARHLEDLAAVDELARALPVEAPGGYFEALPGRVRFKVTPRRRVPRVPAWSWAVAAALLVAVVTPALLRQNPRVAVVARDLAPPPVAAPLAAAPTAAPAAPPMDLADQKEQRADGPREAPAAKPAATEAKQVAAYDELQEAPAKLARGVAPPAQAPAPSAPIGGIAQGTVASNEAAARLAKAEDARAKDKEAEPREPARAPSARTNTFAAPPEGAIEGAAGQHLYEPKPESDDADASATAALEAKKTRAEGKPAAAGRRDAEVGRAEPPAPRLRFRNLKAEVPGDAEGARRLREQWRAFVAQGPSAAQADEGRVRIVEMGAQAWRLSNDDADLILVKSDAEAYLRRDDAAQGDRVRALLATLGN